MEDNKISIITCESGDWTILRYEDFERSGHRIESVSYTHLDVYKRQVVNCQMNN